MAFTSFRFLLFFPIVFGLYWALPFRYRKYMLLAASYYFYMCWKPEFIVLILFSTLVDYLCGLGITSNFQRGGVRNLLLSVSLCMNLGLLFFFKYLNFFGATLTALCRAVSIPFSAPALDIILPVGISFYTFQTLSYTIDVYRGKIEAERDFVTFALFVSFFPQLVAGPIEKASSLLPQLKEAHTFSYDDAAYGLKLMAWGFFKKMVVADRLAALVVDPVFDDLQNHSGGALALATAAFAIQIYCDFGGYSDIARGCAKTMGINLMVNFKAPYLFSVSIADYWRRNHVSLTAWFRDYVYIPLGGNRKGPYKKVLFIFITYFLSGLWHGAAWTFVIWGLLQAVYLCVEPYFPVYAGRFHTPVCAAWVRFRTYFLCCFSLVFFRAGSMSDALYLISRCAAGLARPVEWCRAAYQLLMNTKIAAMIVIFSLILLFLFDFANEKRDTIQLVSNWPFPVRWTVYVLFLFLLVCLIPKGVSRPFIYFQF